MINNKYLFFNGWKIGKGSFLNATLLALLFICCYRQHHLFNIVEFTFTFNVSHSFLFSSSDCAAMRPDSIAAFNEPFIKASPARNILSIT